MGYYDTIRNPSIFQRTAVAKGMLSFGRLKEQTAVSRWGVDRLFACRVLCSQPSNVLPFLADRVPKIEVDIHPCIESLIRGPREALSELSQMAEVQIVRSYQPESLGYIWAALASLLRPRDDVPDTSTSDNDAEGAGTQGSNTAGGRSSERSRTRTDHGPFVPSDTMQVASSSPVDSDNDRPDTALSVPSSIGFVESSAPLVEDHTVRFANCLIRCVLNYAQPLNKGLPFLEFRDERLAYVYGRDEGGIFKAIDDGGIQLRQKGLRAQVAILEAKRSFQDIINGVPSVSDELLAQVVGEALALNNDRVVKISNNNIISIVAVQHYVKFFHLHIPDDFMRDIQTQLPANGCDSYLRAASTDWFDMTQPSGRRYFVRHMLAVIAWADESESEDYTDMDE